MQRAACTRKQTAVIWHYSQCSKSQDVFFPLPDTVIDELRSTQSVKIMMIAARCISAWGLLLVVMGGAPSLSQITPRVTVSGRVIDDSTQAPVQNANVFIANTTLGCGTDENGRFQIRNVPVGPCEIVTSRVGYSMRLMRVTLSESRKSEFEIELRATNVELSEVVVSAPDPVEWKKWAERFRKLFLGTTRNARECRIVNPEVLDFKTDANGAFNASVRAPLQIENPRLGYHIEFYLNLFREVESPPTLVAQSRGPVLMFEGQSQYTELKPSSPDDSVLWKENRQRAFKGSPRHFLISLFNRELEREGFIIRLSSGLSVGASDPRALLTVGESEILWDSPKSHEKILKFKGFLEVEYDGEPVEFGYDLLRKKGSDAQVSWIRLNYDAVTIDSRGLIKDWFPTTISGYWAWKRVADALPLDYDPEKE
jgi:hypothetical protein